MVLFNIFRSAIINFKQSAQFQYSDSKLKTACYVFQVKSLKLSLSYCSRYLRLLIVFVILWTLLLQRCSLLEKCPYFEFFLSVFSRIRSKQGEIPCICPYSARMWENTEQNILNTETFHGKVHFVHQLPSYFQRLPFTNQMHFMFQFERNS